jgi:Rrf2 family protein
MKISYKGDYALKALLDLCYRFESLSPVPIGEISKRQNIPAKYLEQIMLVLKGAGIIGSKRGAGGGFFLLKPPDEILLGDVIGLIEGPIEPIACAKQIHNSTCGEENQCVFREIWLNVMDAIAGVVDHVTFGEIMRRDKELKEKSVGYIYDI